MAPGRRIDPFLGFNFQVEIEGIVVAGFTEVSGIQVEIEVQDYREGGVNEYVHKFAGPTRYPTNLILKRGLTGADTLWKWHQEVKQGTITRKNGSILLLNSAGEESWRWNFLQAYPVKWEGPSLRSTTGEVAVETLELVHRGIMKA
jgi:phage tail-like protein